MDGELIRAASLLNKAGKITFRDFMDLYYAQGHEQIAELILKVYASGHISPSERDELYTAAERDETARAKLRSVLQEGEGFESGRRASPFVQGGLYGLGKRRP